jgi:hypothetical protein
MGIELASHVIHCLLFADLQAILNITEDFANKWNLKFNANKI